MVCSNCAIGYRKRTLIHGLKISFWKVERGLLLSLVTKDFKGPLGVELREIILW